jgi:hypothetical protein
MPEDFQRWDRSLPFPSIPFPSLSFPFLPVLPFPTFSLLLLSFLPSLFHSSLPIFPPFPIPVSLLNRDRGFTKRPENFSTLQIYVSEVQRHLDSHCTTESCLIISGEATRGFGGRVEPPLASRTTPGIRTKPQRNSFWEEVGVPQYLASAYLKL